MENLSEKERNDGRIYMTEKYGYVIETLNDAVFSMVSEQDNQALEYFIKYLKKILIIAKHALDNRDQIESPAMRMK